ncbi:MAG: HD domain-containing protein [Spirochaetes bacterium]|nr:HD domain-containing protein [Spirochaetota bacterium]
MHEIFSALVAAAAGENQALLVWEGYWYTQAAAEQHADDIKRETLPPKLSATAEEIAALTHAMRPFQVETHVSDTETEIRFELRSRQPNRLLCSLKKFQWLPACVAVQGNVLEFQGEPTHRELLQIAVLLARYPQLSVKNAAAAKNPAEALIIPQAQRRHAFKNIVCGRKPSQALKFLDQVGLLETFLPEVTAGRHLTQNRFHAHDIFDHLLHSIDGAYDLNEPVRWSALLHDVGKVPTRVEGPNGEASFHNHEMYSARMVVPIMKRLAVPIGIGQKVKFLVRNHMFHYTDEWSDKAVRRFVKKIPLEELQDLISLRLADRKGSGKKSAFPRALQNLMNHIDEIIEKEKEFKIKDLAIDGHVLMEMGMPQTRAMGDMLKYLFEEVKAGRAENNRDVLVKLVEARRGAATIES